MNDYPMHKPLPQWAIKAIDRIAVIKGYEEQYAKYGDIFIRRGNAHNKRVLLEDDDHMPISLEFKAELMHGIMVTYENYRFGEMNRDELLKEYDKAFSGGFFDPSSIEDQKRLLIPRAEKAVDDAIYRTLPLTKRIMLQAKEAKAIYKNFKDVSF